MPTPASPPSSRKAFLRNSLILLLLTAIAFDVLFWRQDIGINLAVYVLLIACVLLGRHGWKGFSTPARAVMAGMIIAAFFGVWHNSVVAIISCFGSLFVFAALAHEKELRGVFYGIAQAAANYALLPWGAGGTINEALEGRRVPGTVWRWSRLALIPLILLAIYFQIYRVANPKFDHLTAGFLDRFGAWLHDLFSKILTPHALFFLFGLLLSAGLLFRFAPHLMAGHERQWTDLLSRRRTRRARWQAPLALNALERERRMGLILLVMMNALLLVVNAVDISWIWFGFEVPEGFSLKQFVHEGTWLLIVSILLSMLILLRLFRANQNFYWKSGPLRMLAFAWIAQNFILGISVTIRNHHYIHFHGLAYGRIGVIVFLGLVLTGLITLAVKIHRRHSLYHLLRVNAWAAFAAMIGLTTVNWDGLITRYNLTHWNQGEIDVDNYLAMSDKALPLLLANRHRVEQQMNKHLTNEVVWIRRTTMDEFDADLERRRRAFLDRWNATGWQGWNRADAWTFAQLEHMGLAR